MFNSIVKNAAQSALLAALVATALSTVPAVAGDGGGGNTDRLIQHLVDRAIEQEDAQNQSGFKFNTQYTPEPFTHTGLLPNDDGDIIEIDGPGDSYPSARGWSDGFDR